MSEIPSVGERPVRPVDRSDRLHDPHDAEAQAGRRRSHAGPAETGPAGDRVELSEQARLLSALRDRSDVRADLVERIQRDIARGVYDTDAKLQSAIDRMLERLGPQDR